MHIRHQITRPKRTEAESRSKHGPNRAPEEDALDAQAARRSYARKGGLLPLAVGVLALIVVPIAIAGAQAPPVSAKRRRARASRSSFKSSRSRSRRFRPRSRGYPSSRAGAATRAIRVPRAPRGR